MKLEKGSARIAILGFGAIGQKVFKALISDIAPNAVYGVLERSKAALGDNHSRATYFSDLQDVIQWHPKLAIECAGHQVVKDHVPSLLAAGVDVLVISIGALSDVTLRERLANAERAGGSRLLTVAGAIGGLDALRAAKGAKLHSVKYVGRKHPTAWNGTPAEAAFDLPNLTGATTIFDGNAHEAAALYPKNANVTAAVALAGLGFDDTTVQLIADPAINQNIHELEVSGDFGKFCIRLMNQPLPGNPKTSWLAALSIVEELKRYFLHSAKAA